MVNKFNSNYFIIIAISFSLFFGVLLRLYNLNYETLVSDSQNEIKKLLNHCELEWDEKCLKHHNNTTTPIATVSATEARKPIYKSSLNSNKNYSNYLDKYFVKLDKKYLNYK